MAPDQKEQFTPASEKLPSFESAIGSPEKKTVTESTALEQRTPNVILPTANQMSTNQSNAVRDESIIRYKKIESILEEDLGEIYNNLTPADQKIFKMKGEETTRSIFQLVYQKSKIKVKKIVKLIKLWLKSVPGINKFFLEQEAKIKADKIVALADESKVEF